MDKDDDVLIRRAGDDSLEHFETPEEAMQYLRIAGTMADSDLDVGEAALALALVFLPGLHVERYRNHLKKLVEHARDEYAARLRQSGDVTASLQAEVLRKIIHESHGYKGDNETYDDLQNANLIRVIERRAGLPVALGILYVVVGRGCGFQVDGLRFPGHFLLRLEYEGQRLILDPFDGGREMTAADLRQLVKKLIGEQAELSHNYYEAVTTRELLLRLQNNLKSRLIEREEYAQALLVIETMAALAPDEPRTSFDKAILYAKLGQVQQAASALEDYILRIPDAREKQQAKALLQQILRLQ